MPYEAFASSYSEDIRQEASFIRPDVKIILVADSPVVKRGEAEMTTAMAAMPVE